MEQCVCITVKCSTVCQLLPSGSQVRLIRSIAPSFRNVRLKLTRVIAVIIIIRANEIFQLRMVKIGSPSIHLLYPLLPAFRDRGVCRCCHRTWTKMGSTLVTSVHHSGTLSIIPAQLGRTGKAPVSKAIWVIETSKP